jgi:hypothetical protein
MERNAMAIVEYTQKSQNFAIMPVEAAALGGPKNKSYPTTG